ncbi:hypothetical protein HLY09_26385 [Enterocloster bolteae]|jgi:hypothetical protein|uniref:hypothetical protein n=1 Tax=Enterocloster bolteae TaxID=208479 RepID=UPI00148BF555|nr:hypothetical protein [Enterocloster bolteae]QJU22654.1 hypothetical protein HLY09_26385 [Enterocloster bolteae]
MFNKIRDFMDTNVSMIILMDTEEELSILAKIFCSIGRERLSYEMYKDDITAYMIEVSMPYNRYLKMMKLLIKNGYNLRPESKADIIQRMVKTES